ncbi:hypothetical protein [Micromonospora tarensis]|uniref:Uncharacterized protein n=1 Tax=Micromonospora tarensis TaxID=2806100 RepID=A0ABS1YCL9_9ACTN|nr:hypothetical protein [Micromonospora tarensis]MBM0275097.1 hypothetical protein [Micromonospora tarensis]
MDDLMGTNVYAAKRLLFARLGVLAGDGQPLAGLQVAYSIPRPAALARECVYGGGVRFTHTDATAERNVLLDEVALVSAYIRIAGDTTATVEDTDARAEVVFAKLAAQLTAWPDLGQALAFAGITQGQGDYDLAPGETLTILGVQVRIESTVTYGGG